MIPAIYFVILVSIIKEFQQEPKTVLEIKILRPLNVSQITYFP